MKKTSSGFTIVELLIVIVVIGILAAITLVAFGGVQQRARDAERVSEVNAIKKQLEAFYAINGYYPNSTRVGNASWRLANLQLDNNASRAPGNSGNLISYCWATDPNRYCYVAYPPAGSSETNCTGNISIDDTCVRYALSYRLESDPGTMITVSSANQ